MMMRKFCGFLSIATNTPHYEKHSYRFQQKRQALLLSTNKNLSVLERISVSTQFRASPFERALFSALNESKNFTDLHCYT